jgi:hypothetical protein
MGFTELIILAFLGFIVYVYWKIVAKTGHSGWLSLLMVVPLANFIVMLVLAFSEWPIERELRGLKSPGRDGQPDNP